MTGYGMQQLKTCYIIFQSEMEVDETVDCPNCKTELVKQLSIAICDCGFHCTIQEYNILQTRSKIYYRQWLLKGYN